MPRPPPLVPRLRSRRAAVFLSLFMMAFSTFSMGCLPTYASVGVLAPLLLVFVRLLQGLSVGGQLVGTYVLLPCARAPQPLVAVGAVDGACDDCRVPHPPMSVALHCPGT